MGRHTKKRYTQTSTTPKFSKRAEAARNRNKAVCKACSDRRHKVGTITRTSLSPCCVAEPLSTYSAIVGPSQVRSAASVRKEELNAFQRA